MGSALFSHLNLTCGQMQRTGSHLIQQTCDTHLNILPGSAFKEKLEQHQRLTYRSSSSHHLLLTRAHLVFLHHQLNMLIFSRSSLLCCAPAPRMMTMNWWPSLFPAAHRAVLSRRSSVRVQSVGVLTLRGGR